jgi:hypothetical protein
MMSNEKRLNLYYQNPKLAVLADPALIIEKFWKEFYGFCVPAPGGRIFPNDTLAPLLVGAG